MNITKGNHERGLYQRGNTWYILYYVDGIRKREAAGTSKQCARELLAKRRVQAKEGSIFDIKKDKITTFDEIAKDFLQYSETNKRSYWRDVILVKHLLTRFKGKKLVEITPHLIEQYKNVRLKDDNRKPATVNRELACMKAIFNWAIKGKKATSNPVREVDFLEENNTILRFLDRDEIKRLLDACSQHLKPIVVTALNTGMRKSEILELKWKDVNFNEGFINIEKTKSGKSRRIRINSMLYDTLKKCKSWSDGEHVFCNSDKKPYSKHIRTNFQNALKRAKIENFRFHDLRHSAASYLAMKSGNLFSVKEMLGHSSMKTTLRYAHLSESHMKAEMELLGSVMREATTATATPTATEEKLDKNNFKKYNNKEHVISTNC